MIVFDLRCAEEHVFEAWFASSTAYDDQRARKLIACPVCADTARRLAIVPASTSPVPAVDSHEVARAEKAS